MPAPPGGPRYILIDALDEALLGPEDSPNLVKLLAPRLERLPGWLRLVATSRLESEVERRFGALRVELIETRGQNNLDDLDTYVTFRLRAPDLAERLRCSVPGRTGTAVLANKAAVTSSRPASAAGGGARRVRIRPAGDVAAGAGRHLRRLLRAALLLGYELCPRSPRAGSGGGCRRAPDSGAVG